MKQWTTPEITELNINETAHEWRIQPDRDGGYLGDGQISGWFGEPENGIS